MRQVRCVHDSSNTHRKNGSSPCARQHEHREERLCICAMHSGRGVGVCKMALSDLGCSGPFAGEPLGQPLFHA
jgi:hypothetical protein